MRNIVEYPLQPSEAFEAIDRAISRYAELKMIGGIDGYALHMVRQFLQTQPEAFEQFLKQNPLL